MITVGYIIMEYANFSNFFLATPTEPRTSNAMLSSMRIPTISWCATWRTKWLDWRSCSVLRAWETSWTVSFMPPHGLYRLCQGLPQAGNIFYLHYCLIAFSHLSLFFITGLVPVHGTKLKPLKKKKQTIELFLLYKYMYFAINVLIPVEHEW